MIHQKILYDDCAYLYLCATGQVDNLATFLEMEKRYSFSSAECNNYRRALDTAASVQAMEDNHSSNTDWRYRICRWMLRASDDFSISRGTAIMALSYFDRFFLRKESNITKHLLQVVSTTCLFVACKIFESKPMKLTTLMTYTKNKFDRSEILAMEGTLVALLWMGSYVYPPTAGSFALMFMSRVLLHCDTLHLSRAIEICQFVIELATCDSFFLAFRQSKVAVAAIIVTLEQMNTSSEQIQNILLNMEEKNCIQCRDDRETLICVNHLRKIYCHNNARIQEIDGIVTMKMTTRNNNDRCENNIMICRIATPSPTPEDESTINSVGYRCNSSSSTSTEMQRNDLQTRDMNSTLFVPSLTNDDEEDADCTDRNKIDSGQCCKRQRQCGKRNCSSSTKKCTIN